MYERNINEMVSALVSHGVIEDMPEMQDAAKKALMSCWNDKIADVWSCEDVRTQADEELSDEDCMLILRRIHGDHDASVGINWDVIETYIEEFRQHKSTD